MQRTKVIHYFGAFALIWEAKLNALSQKKSQPTVFIHYSLLA